MTWKVEFDAEAAKELRNLDFSIKRRILQYLRERIATDEDPRRFGSPLKRELTGFWKYRIGDYRLITKIEENILTVLVIKIGHRKNVYD